MYNQGFGGPGGPGGFGGPRPGFGGPRPGFGGPQGGFGGPQGGFGGPQGGFGGPQGGFGGQQQQFNNAPTNDDDEYEYITDDEGDFIEDENGNIMTPQEAETRGLVTRSDGTTDRGIGKNLLIGGAVLGGLWIMNKQLKKKKRVKKANPDNVPYKWVEFKGTFPTTNLVSFKNSLGKTFVIARGKYKDGIHCGYADAKNKHMYTSYGGKEVVLDKYEVLTCPANRLQWVKCTNPAQINSAKAVVGGYESDGQEIFVTKCRRDTVEYFGKTNKKAYCAYYGFDGKEFRINDFEVLMFN